MAGDAGVRAVVVLDEFQEADIRPQPLFARYLELLATDLPAFFPPADLVEVICPACGRTAGEVAIEKFGFTYRLCPQCLTLFLSPRPGPAALERYHREGASARFWREVLIRETDEARREHIFRPRAEWLADIAAEFLPRPRRLALLGTGASAFTEEVQRTRAFDTMDDGGLADALAAFDVLERAFDPGGLLDRAAAGLRGGGILALTTRTASGFDLLVLWEQSKHLLPAVYLNLFSIDALQEALDRRGFELLEVSTPGQLDVEIVLNRLRDEPTLALPRVVRYLLERRPPEARQALQEYLQRFRLSSHARVLARKRRQREA